nr:transposase [Acinetobacter rathckeae]
MTRELKDILLVDKNSYLSKAKTEILVSRGLKLITPRCRKIKQNQPVPDDTKALLSKRELIKPSMIHLKNYIILSIQNIVQGSSLC